TGVQTYNDATVFFQNAVFDAGTATITFGNSVQANAFDTTITANEIHLAGAAGSFTGTGNLLLQPSADDVAIRLGSPTADPNGAGAPFELTAGELATLGPGFNM